MLPMDFSSVLQAFAAPCSLRVFDALGEYCNGSWQESEARQRKDSVLAIVFGMSPEDLALHKQGEAAIGGIAVHTADTLFFTDVYDPSWAVDPAGSAFSAGDTGPEYLEHPEFPAGPFARENRQSYVEYMGRRYRIVGEGQLFGNATSRLYHGIRYIL